MFAVKIKIKKQTNKKGCSHEQTHGNRTHTAVEVHRGLLASINRKKESLHCRKRASDTHTHRGNPSEPGQSRVFMMSVPARLFSSETFSVAFR